MPQPEQNRTFAWGALLLSGCKCCFGHALSVIGFSSILTKGIKARHMFLVDTYMSSVITKQKALDKIAKEISTCKICQVHSIGKAVPGEGNPDADIVFLGEAPGKKEAETGRPFVGPSGKVLRALIADAGLKDEDVFITSPVKFLPEYVTPTPKDVAHAVVHLEKQLQVIEPKIIVLLGRIAALAILKEEIQVSKRHGEIIKKDSYTYLLTYHPAAPLYSPKIKTELMNDFKKLKTLIK